MMIELAAYQSIADQRLPLVQRTYTMHVKSTPYDSNANVTIVRCIMKMALVGVSALRALKANKAPTVFSIATATNDSASGGADYS
jgi:hypothetical protein